FQRRRHRVAPELRHHQQPRRLRLGQHVAQLGRLVGRVDGDERHSGQGGAELHDGPFGDVRCPHGDVLAGLEPAPEGEGGPLGGAPGVLGSVTLPWVTVKGALPGVLHLDLLGADASPLSKTVSGTDTKAWPIVAAVGAAVAVLAVLGLARKLLLLLGLLTTLAGGGLLNYVLNVVDIETKGNA